jgi:exonuclease III
MAMRLFFIFLFFVSSCDVSSLSSHSGPSLKICSFNIQFLGYSTKRKNTEVSKVLSTCDLIAVQELVSPPHSGVFPDGVTPYKPDPQSASFFAAMKAQGYSFVLSEEDTGPGEKNRTNSSATEWWVVFYRNGKVKPTLKTFLSEDRTANPNFERVPYAFGFKSVDGKTDFVLISVHLKPGKSNSVRRKQELSAVSAWIHSRGTKEKDYIVLGDMNIENKAELLKISPYCMQSLNSGMLPTNTNLNSPKPYDHILVHPYYSKEAKGFGVINLLSHFNVKNYNHNSFRYLYSDHHPIFIKWEYSYDDD